MPVAADFTAVRRHYTYQQQVAAAAVRAAQLAWAKVSLADPAGSWRRVGPGLVALIIAAQVAAARDADPYLTQVLAEQGQTDDPAGEIQPAAFAGVAADGRPLDSLLSIPADAVPVAILAGTAPAQALASQGLRLQMLAETTVQDTGRGAVSAGIAVRPRVGGYVRMLVPPSCSRCVILAGRWYRWSKGFQRHPHCFPAGTVVSGPAHEAATRRWYEGELVVIRTAGGKELSATGNHPVLTDRGWVPANLLQEGDQVVGSVSGNQSARALVVPDEHQMPARIEDLWRADRVGSLRRVPTTTEDFHGDGGHGEVDVVLANRLLGHHGQSALHEYVAEEHLARRAVPAVALLQAGAADEGLFALAGTAQGGMRRGGLAEAFRRGHFPGAVETGRGSAADLHPGGLKIGPDGGTRYPEPQTEAVLALSGLVGGDDLPPGDVGLEPRWDAPTRPFSVENASAYAGRGVDLLHRLADQVELDRVVELRRVRWSGHVYNLSSIEGWYGANGLIVSNCDCRHIPASEDAGRDLTTDPKAYFESLTEAQQNATFTHAGAEAIRLGSDMNQVVNARRGALGLTPAGARLTLEEQKILRNGLERGRLQGVSLFGRPVYITTEGVTRRGIAGTRLGAWEDGVKGRSRYRQARTERLMPESILQIATDRQDAVRLLKRYGYVL